MANVSPLQNVLFFGFGGQVAWNQNLKTKNPKKNKKKKWGFLRFWIAKFPKNTLLIDIDWHLY